MDRKKIESCLGYVIRSRKGFYYNNKKYNAIAYYNDCIEIYMNDYEYWENINYEDILKIENVIVENELQKTIFTR